MFLVGDVSLRSQDLGAYSYAQFWRTLLGKTYMAFRVKAPHDVYVILTTTPNVVDTNAYEIRIGIDSNMK